VIEKRSGSQILFGFLPEQTVDLRGSVWKVREWRNPEPTRAIEQTGLRRELVRQATPWAANGRDANYVRNLLSGYDVKVLQLNMQAGVAVEPYPRVWACKACGRVGNRGNARCACGGRFAQLPFVGYHEGCGGICEPVMPSCREHQKARIVSRISARIDEITFVCPDCQRVLQRGMGFRRCMACGDGNFIFQVHRAASVYTGRTLVLVNPPGTPQVKRLLDAGGPARALDWVLDGRTEGSFDEVGASRESLRAQLLSQGLSATLVDTLVNQAAASGELGRAGAAPNLGEDEKMRAQNAAVKIAMGLAQSRVRVQDLLRPLDLGASMAEKYREDYPAAFAAAGIESIELVDKFPVFTGAFGYTRGDPTPGRTKLVPFKDRRGDYVVYGDLSETEALLVTLRPSAVASWMVRSGYGLKQFDDERSARIALLDIGPIPDSGDDERQATAGCALLTLVHSYAHWFVRRLAVHSGIERSALCELLVPEHAAFFVYAANRGDFVLGGLQALFETEMDLFLRELVTSDLRCPLDPGCAGAKAACMACLHLGEPSCGYFNRFLRRTTLSGDAGYLAMLASQ